MNFAGERAFHSVKLIMREYKTGVKLKTILPSRMGEINSHPMM